MSDARVVLVTAPDEACARDMAQALVQEGLAACVNLLPAISSIYVWQGSVQIEGESLLLIKTCAERLPELQARLLELHPYDVPELIALDPTHVEERYLRWLLAAVTQPGGA